MGLFKKKTARVLRKGDAVEERTVRTVGDQKVTVRKFSTRETTKKQPRAERQKAGGGRRHRDRSPATAKRERRSRPRPEIVIPPETARKQMLVRTLPHQTQIVVLEGPVLVEHYVARSDKRSLIGNVYIGKVRNVLPGMEAAFIDFGEGKNGVLYAGDINFDDLDL